MPRPRKEALSTKGKGRCGTPGCPDDKAPGHFLCMFHSELVLPIKIELENEQENGRFANGYLNEDEVFEQVGSNHE